MSGMRIHLLDDFVVTVDGTRVPDTAWRGERNRTLLQFLATRPQARATREELIDALWSHLPVDQARGSLHVTVSRLRRALSSMAPGLSGDQLVQATPTGYQLAERTWVDVAALQALVEEIRVLHTHDRTGTLQRIADLHWAQLPELQVDQPYSDWATTVRERVRRDYVSLQVLRADLLHAAGQSEQALTVLISLLDTEPVLESAARLAMSIAFHLGNQVLALSIFDRCRRALAEELGVSPLPETLALHARILAHHQVVETKGAQPAPATWAVQPSVSPGRMTYLSAHIHRFEHLQAQPTNLVTQALDLYLRRVIAIANAYQGRLLQQVETEQTVTIQFAHPLAAVAAAIDLGRALQEPGSSERLSLSVGQALHSGLEGEAEITDADLARDRCATLARVTHGGQLLLSESLAQAIGTALPDGATLRELGAHRLADLAAAEPLYQLIHPSLPAEFPPIRSLEGRPGNLPVQLSSFVGRRREVEQAGRLLRSARLLTLTGPGGVGKTRLALQLGALAALDSCPDGVWFVTLASVASPAHVGVAILELLGLSDQAPQPPIARLTAYLRSKRLLLILDNCEHLIEACADLANALLQSCPQISILATSREPLSVQGEVLLPLSGMPVPDPAAVTDLRKLRDFDATRLFLQRVQAVNPQLNLSELNPTQVAAICRSLDGLPLALELAAARTRSLTIEQIAERLQDRFRLLTSGIRTAEARHQTLLATIDWSYDLLTEPERILLRRLSVFAGGCTLPMVEAICADERLAAEAILTLLFQLVDRSLVVADRQGDEVRYRLLETIRHYAATKLKAADEAGELSDRHLAYFANLVLNGAPRSFSGEQSAWFDELNAEMDNIRAALNWSLGAGSVSDGLVLATFLSTFWEARGHVREGREVMNALLAHPGAPATGIHWARAQMAAADLAFVHGDLEEAIGQGAQALALLKELDDPVFTVLCLTSLGWSSLRAGDLPAAQRYLDEAVERSVFPALAYAAYCGLSRVYAGLGDFDQAEAAMESAMAGVSMLQNPKGIAIAHAHKGALALDRERYVEALSLLVESAGQLAQLQDVSSLTIPFGLLARVLQQMGRLEEAALLFGAIEGLRDRTGTATIGSDRAEYLKSMEETRSGLGAAFAIHYDSGLRMELNELLIRISTLVSVG